MKLTYVHQHLAEQDIQQYIAQGVSWPSAKLQPYLHFICNASVAEVQGPISQGGRLKLSY